MYDNIRKKVNKFHKGGKIPKYDLGAAIQKLMSQRGLTEEQATQELQQYTVNGVFDENKFNEATRMAEAEEQLREATEADEAAQKEKNLANFSSFGADIASKGIQALDEGLMGDKNFGSQSQAIDSAVHGVSSALMKSGNPYAAMAGVAIEGVNFLSKAGGSTVQGYDVDINSSGYGMLGHQESSSSRSLFGFNTGRLNDKLARRNAQARMALAAADIADDQKFEQEARMDSISNTVRNNQIALAGGTQLNSLGA